MKEKEIAKWMLCKIEEEYYIYQEDIVYQIEEEFGEDYVYENENCNLSISKDVLKEFRKISEDTVVWERGEKMWRKREDYDPQGKRQAD